MDPTARRQLGRTSIDVTVLGFGAGTLGDPVDIIDDRQAYATVEAAFQGGVGFFDTAPWYGLGKSEHRVGAFLRQVRRDRFVISTKVGRVLKRPDKLGSEPPCARRWAGGLPFDLRFDYSREGVLRSYEDSLQRLGMASVDALLIHDLDRKFHDAEALAWHLKALESGGFGALERLKSSAEIQAIGAGVNHTGMIPILLKRFPLDFILLAMPYTLLDQDALDGELQMCMEAGVAVVIGAVFSSGILATGATHRAIYSYRQAPPSVLEKTSRIQAICDRHRVPLGAAALQFPLSHPAVASVIPGGNSPEIVRQNLHWMTLDIPVDLWQELKDEGLLRYDAPTPQCVESAA